MGRSRTATVRERFRTSTDPVIDPRCTYPACVTLVPPALDTIEHTLLSCPRHTSARSVYTFELTNHYRPAIPFTLSSVLLASLPPHPFKTHLLWQLLSSSNLFLDRIEAERGRDGCTPLDTG